MAIWQWALLALALLWGFQSLGVWFQMRHYTDVMKGISNKYKDGYVGAGHIRGRFGKGVIVLIVVDRDLVVRRMLEMSGRTVFAKFARRDAYEGLTLAQLREKLEQGAFDAGVAHAVRSAIEQAERLADQSEEQSGLSGLKTVAV
ncbi:transcriptional regulator GutM [Pseudochrobactrum sp. sp1633]|uniref:transcriptional regulator GutM n=1 Tax=Pseudochrobactrum sp. sp1633 TaxID=3036706 RepID=UPI0025A4CF4D|nr:transcriptional regulator GutM [Pseudochrobactrum sp. sp1633]MDM8346835.1 transcriptional regulator GutM [Pseudochrobactrum sp. sp1633]HWD12556.1 transcriptional regulator GutM [Pseudochrobactrum sp.]